MLQHQTRIQMLCCAECCILLSSKTAISHIRVYHSTLQVKIPKSKFNDLCSELGIRNNYPSHKELHGIDALSGLDLYMMALVCQYDGCSMICASGGAMCKHYKTSHIKGEECIPTKWAVTSAQRLDNNHHRRYFQVNSPSSELKRAMNNDWIDNLESDLEEVHSHIALDSANPRNVNPLLKHTRWPEHVIGFEPEELRSFASLPDNNEFPMLRETIGWIVRVAMVAVNLTPKVILHSLNRKNKQM